jgi:hypothetical protein
MTLYFNKLACASGAKQELKVKKALPVDQARGSRRRLNCRYLRSSPFAFLGQSVNAMSISGLVPLFKPIQQRKHLSELSGKTLAVEMLIYS